MRPSALRRTKKRGPEKDRVYRAAGQAAAGETGHTGSGAGISLILKPSPSQETQ